MDKIFKTGKMSEEPTPHVLIRERLNSFSSLTAPTYIPLSRGWRGHLLLQTIHPFNHEGSETAARIAH